MSSPYRQLPSVDRLLNDERVRHFGEAYAPQIVVEMAREQLEEARAAIAAGQPSPGYEDLVSSLVERLASVIAPSLRRVINATGVIIHTNLGRAPVSVESIAAMGDVTGGYSNLEFNLGEGERSNPTCTSSRCSAGLPAPRQRWQ